MSRLGLRPRLVGQMGSGLRVSDVLQKISHSVVSYVYYVWVICPGFLTFNRIGTAENVVENFS